MGVVQILMSFLDNIISELNSYLPEGLRIPDDRRQWWPAQVCAHVALLVVFATLVLGVSIWLGDSDIVLDLQFVMDSLFILGPGLFLIQVYYVPMYLRYLDGGVRLWKFFGGTLLGGVIGLLAYPVFDLLFPKVWAQLMLIFASAVSGLMLAGALIMHLLFKSWQSHHKQNDDLLPPSSGRL